jgi:hypothetical protein
MKKRKQSPAQQQRSEDKEAKKTAEAERINKRNDELREKLFPLKDRGVKAVKAMLKPDTISSLVRQSQTTAYVFVRV